MASAQPGSTALPNSERGATLVLVIVTLFVLGGLASTCFLLSFIENRLGRQLVRYKQAAAAADAGAYAPLSQWDVLRYNRLEIGGSAAFSGNSPDGTGSYEGVVRRTGTQMYLVMSEGSSADKNVIQRRGALYRLRPPTVAIAAALEIGGRVDSERTVQISGSDRSPYGWHCSPEGDELPAVKNGVSGGGSSGLSASMVADLRAVTAHMLNGGVVRTQPRESNGICVTADPLNWGNPIDVGGGCGDHFPAVYSVGDLTVQGGFGQGVLVVDGDLTVGGGFQYFGVVIVLGRFMSVGVGSQITGAVIVANRNQEPQSLSGMTRIQYSSCVISKSLAPLGRGVLLRERSWLDMY